MIPKILHKIWIGEGTDPLDHSDRWLNVMPDYTLQLWDNNAVKPYVQELITRCGEIPKISLVQATDIIRMMIVRDHGGVYLDHDYIIEKDFTHLLDSPFVSVRTHTSDGELKPKYFHPDVNWRTITRANVNSLDGLLAFVVDESFPGAVRGGTLDVFFFAAEPESKVITTAIDIMIADIVKPFDQRMPFWDWGNGGMALTQSCVIHGVPLCSKDDYAANDNGKIYHNKYFYPWSQSDWDLGCVHGYHIGHATGREIMQTAAYDDDLYQQVITSFIPWCERYFNV